MIGDWDAVGVGGINTDFHVRGPALPRPGEPVHGDALVLGSGGRGANQAVAAARLGARVALVGAVGADERGDALIRHLQQEGVNTSGMLRRSDAETGAAVIQSDE